MYLWLSREKKFHESFVTVQIPCPDTWNVYTHTSVHKCTYLYMTYTNAQTRIPVVMLLASRPPHWTSTTTFWLYRSQKCNSLAHPGHLSLAHPIPVTPLDRKMAQDRKPPPHIPYTSLHGPALRTPFLGSVKFNSFQPLGYFESASWGRPQKEARRGDKFAVTGN